MDFLSVFSVIFSGIVDVMCGISFMGITLFQFSVGLSVLALGIYVFMRLFIGDHK